LKKGFSSGQKSILDELPIIYSLETWEMNDLAASGEVS
jgi:hypothetical protein